MSDTGGGRTVGVVGEGPDELVAAVADAGGSVRNGDVETVLAADPDVVVAGGRSTLADLVSRGVDAPLVPVDLDRGFRPVAQSDLADVVPRLVAGEWRNERHVAVSVAVNGTSAGTALADATLVTETAARISEFTVTADDPVDRFRADGVVVATPAGSAGYARAAGGPVVVPGQGVVAVVPIAPFATDPDHWVIPTESVEIVVERDEATVTLLVDDREARTLSQGDAVTLSTASEFTVAVVPESRSRFGQRELERH